MNFKKCNFYRDDVAHIFYSTNTNMEFFRITETLSKKTKQRFHNFSHDFWGFFKVLQFLRHDSIWKIDKNEEKHLHSIFYFYTHYYSMEFPRTKNTEIFGKNSGFINNFKKFNKICILEKLLGNFFICKNYLFNFGHDFVWIPGWGRLHAPCKSQRPGLNFSTVIHSIANFTKKKYFIISME